MFNDWRVEHYISDHVVHSMKPFLKTTASGANFKEQLWLVQKGKSESIPKLSRQKGIFSRPFHTLKESEVEAEHGRWYGLVSIKHTIKHGRSGKIWGVMLQDSRSELEAQESGFQWTSSLSVEE